MLYVERTTENTTTYCKQRIIANDPDSHEYWRNRLVGEYHAWHTPFMQNSVQTGITHAIECQPEEITVFHVDFPKEFAKTPYVTATIYSSSTSIYYTALTMTITSISKTGFDIRLYNGHTDLFMPGVLWLAVEL